MTSLLIFTGLTLSTFLGLVAGLVMAALGQRDGFQQQGEGDRGHG